jgi:hypothetical protein
MVINKVKTDQFKKVFKHPNNESSPILGPVQVVPSSKYVAASKDKQVNKMIKSDKITGMYINEYDMIVISDEGPSKKDKDDAKYWGRPIKDQLNAKRQTALAHELVHKVVYGNPDKIFGSKLKPGVILNDINKFRKAEGSKLWGGKDYLELKKSYTNRARDRGINPNVYFGEELVAFKTEMDPKSTYKYPDTWYTKKVFNEMAKKKTHDRIYKQKIINIKEEN